MALNEGVLMSEIKMVVVNGIRYRPEDAPKQQKEQPKPAQKAEKPAAKSAEKSKK